MKRMNLAEAQRLAAQADAYSWYCQANGVADPEIDRAGLDGKNEQHADAWAWASKNWKAFLAHTVSPESQFLIDLLHRGASYCREKYGQERKNPADYLQAGRTAGPEQRRGQGRSYSKPNGLQAKMSDVSGFGIH